MTRFLASVYVVGLACLKWFKNRKKNGLCQEQKKQRVMETLSLSLNSSKQNSSFNKVTVNITCDKSIYPSIRHQEI